MSLGGKKHPPLGVNNPARIRTFHFDKTVQVEITSASERKQQKLSDFPASVKANSKTVDSGGSGNDCVS